MSRQIVRGPTERAHGTRGILVSRRLAGLLARGLMRLTVRGRDNLPSSGVLLAVNHASYRWSSGCCGGPARSSSRPRCSPVSRAGSCHGSARYRYAARCPSGSRCSPRWPTLEEGGIVGIFPEGTRGGGGVQQVRHGIAYLALRSGCPVVPVACLGTERVLAKGRLLPRLRQPVTVAFGRPTQVAEPGTAPNRQHVTAASESVRVLLADHILATAAGPTAAAPPPPRAPRPPRAALPPASPASPATRPGPGSVLTDTPTAGAAPTAPAPAATPATSPAVPADAAADPGGPSR